MTIAGPRNSITDIAGIRVGNAADAALKSGVTAIVCDRPSVASVHVMGGAPGTRETDLLAPENSVETVNGLVLSGGSAFGLDAASGVQALLREQGIGFDFAGQIIPIVPSAILFDLINGGNKDWDRYSPYRDLGYQAAEAASAEFDIGTAGAGYGAMIATLKGGLGTASAKLPFGATIGALVAVNAIGNTMVGSTRHFWAAPFEQGAEFGGSGYPERLPDDASVLRTKLGHGAQPGANTTIAVIATDAKLTKAQAKRLAIAAHDGFARAIWPAHTPFDGDLVFALATGSSDQAPGDLDWVEMSAVAASTMARAIARGVYAATPQDDDLVPAWQKAFGA